MKIVLGILLGILLYILLRRGHTFWDAYCKTWCQEKMGYDWEYDMVFSQMPNHHCRKCKKERNP